LCRLGHFFTCVRIGLGWLLGCCPGQALSDSVTLYAMPSPAGIDWRNPHELAKSVLWNHLTFVPFTLSHRIGHANVEILCESNRQVAKRHILTGMTNSAGTGPSDLKLLVLNGVGLGILLHNFAGTLQSESEIQQDLTERFQAQGAVSFIRFEISSATCAHLTHYFDEYRERGFDQHYGLPNRPRYGEGAGCSAFAMSFLELVGILDHPSFQAFKRSWSKTIRIPDRLVAKSYTQSSHSPEWLGLWRLLLPFREALSWAIEQEETAREVFFWDPDAIYHWIEAQWNSADENSSGVFRREHKHAAIGLTADVTHIRVPQGPVWLEVIP